MMGSLRGSVVIRGDTVNLGIPTKKLRISWVMSPQSSTLPETNMTSPLKMDGWKTILSYWVSAYFQGRLLLLLVSGSVTVKVKVHTVDGRIPAITTWDV